MRRALVVVAVLGTSLGATCGDNLFPREILAQQEVEAYCEQAARCGQYRDVNTCIYELDPADFHLPAIIQRALTPGYAAAIGSGAIRYDATYARACMDALAALSCDASSRDARVEPAACTAMLVGQVAEGGPCVFDQECTTGRCTPAAQCPDDYACCIGTCGSQAHAEPLADPCAVDSDCAVDAFCSGAGCHALLGSGESCSASAQCDYGLACLRASAGQSGTCGPPPTLGQPCPFHTCADIGTACIAGTCVALGMPTQPCAVTSDCALREVCDPTGHCVLPPGLGSACTELCAPGAWCNLADGSGTCDAPLPDGSMCTFSEQCASLFCADGQFAETCIERPVCF